MVYKSVLFAAASLFNVIIFLYFISFYYILSFNVPYCSVHTVLWTICIKHSTFSVSCPWFPRSSGYSRYTMDIFSIHFI